MHTLTCLKSSLQSVNGFDAGSLFNGIESYILRVFLYFIKEGVPDKGDNFQEFRLQALDVINDVVFVIGSNECFNEVIISNGD